MRKIDDGALLRAYSASGSETDFALLVQRHVDFIYATALRIVAGDTMLAEDVTQSVFMDLARKARSLSNRTDLTGWLYRSTCFASAKAVRSERRRQVREAEAHAMQEQQRDSQPTADWEELRAVLDGVMLELKASDREAVLLRYFQGCSFADVGSRLGLNENAARMRVDRALDRLQHLLARRGISSSSAALAVVLAHQTACAAPAGLAATIVGASVAGATAASTMSAFAWMTMINAKPIVLGALVVAGVMTPIGLQYRTHLRQAVEIETLHQQLIEASRTESPAHNQIDVDELDRLRRNHRELIRLRAELAALRRRVADTPPVPVTAPANATAHETAQIEALARTEATEFLSRPAREQGSLLGRMRNYPLLLSLAAGTPPPEWEQAYKVAMEVRPSLDGLESSPAEFAEFQSAFIQAAIGLEDEDTILQIRNIIQETYEQAVAAHLDAASRPEDAVEEWAYSRDALDRPATQAVQRLLTAEERERFDQLFLGIMGIDLGFGDGAWHRFVAADGSVHFPAESSPPGARADSP